MWCVKNTIKIMCSVQSDVCTVDSSSHSLKMEYKNIRKNFKMKKKESFHYLLCIFFKSLKEPNAVPVNRHCLGKEENANNSGVDKRREKMSKENKDTSGSQVILQRQKSHFC